MKTKDDCGKMVAEADFIFEQEIKDNTFESNKAPVIFGELRMSLG